MQNGSAFAGWGGMENLIPLVVGLARANTPATDGSLEQLVESYKQNCDGTHPEGQSICSITEGRTQTPEAFFRYGRPDDALAVLRGFQSDPRKTYPEVSFTFVENCVAGLLGLAPDAGAHALRTRHRLPQEMGWAAADNIPVGGHTVAVRHERGLLGAMRTIVEHKAYTAPGPTSGPNGGDWGYDHADARAPAPPVPPSPSPAAPDVAPPLRLTVQLAGRHAAVTVNNKRVRTRVVYQEDDTRLPLTEVNATVPLGKSLVVAAAKAAGSSSGGAIKTDDRAPAAWKQDRFAISLWVDPQVAPAEFDERYAEIAVSAAALLSAFSRKV